MERQLDYVARNVPRYTSYPTAPHFTEEVNGATGAAWMEEISADATILLYLHVPFCRAICHYCSSHTKAARRDEPIIAHAALLGQEIEAAPSRHRAKTRPWRLPLLHGETRSCIGITEPDVASSDPTNLQTTIRRDGGEYIVNGRKWFTTGALHPKARFVIVMGLSDVREEAGRHARHSMVLVPFDTPGVEIVRNLPIMGHHSPEGHCEVLVRDVRVPKDHLLGSEGDGFALAQARLGPGRVHHCMRTIGQCELALELMCERVLERQMFGRRLSDFANVQDWIAESRMEIDQARLLVLRAAWLMDMRGNKAAHVDVSAIKVVAANLQTRVADRAIQVFGAMGLTDDTPLALLWTWGRALRFIDGPDEVHKRVVARHELKHAKAKLGRTTTYLASASGAS
jgi:acyl-CoA dehydrogenase